VTLIINDIEKHYERLTMKSDVENITIVVNNEKVPLNPFVKDVTRNVVLGLIQSLKLKESPENIRIEIDLHGINNF
jgi:hypothetical protein